MWGGNIPIVYPQQFGAVGDGETDDTKALVTALSHSNSVVDGGNKKYKYFEIIVNNVEDLEVRNVIFWKGANMVLEGCKNIRFVNCTWEGINPNGVNKIWTCGIRLRGRTENGESIWCLPCTMRDARMSALRQSSCATTPLNLPSITTIRVCGRMSTVVPLSRTGCVDYKA